MKIYLAARIGRKDEVRILEEKLCFHGFEVVSEWHKNTGDDSDYSDRALKAFARLDLTAIEKSDIFVSLTETPGEEIPGASRGGRFVEMGYALAKGKRVCVIGPRENIFCLLPGVSHFESVQEFVERGM